MPGTIDALLEAIDHYGARHPEEKETVQRFRDFVATRPDCAERSLAEGHLTGSAWITNSDGSEIFLTHHAKLNLWLQPGGHADGDLDLLNVALRETDEETSLDPIEVISPHIFDLDIHRIPARKNEPEHFHYDVRYLVRHTGEGHFQVTEESHDLAWVALEKIPSYTSDLSMLRMAQKWQETLVENQLIE